MIYTMNTLDDSNYGSRPACPLQQDDYERINRIMSKYRSEKYSSYEAAYDTTQDTLTNTFVGQFYFASLSVVGLFILFRMMQPFK
jgi:hypothetical protein